MSAHFRAALPVPEPGQGSALPCPRPRRASRSVRDRSARSRGSFRAGQRSQRGERRSRRGAPAAVGDACGSREAPGEPAQVEREQLVGAGAGGGREKVEKRAGTGGDGGTGEGGGRSSFCASVPRSPARRLKGRALLPEGGGAAAAVPGHVAGAALSLVDSPGNSREKWLCAGSDLAQGEGLCVCACLCVCARQGGCRSGCAAPYAAGDLRAPSPAPGAGQSPRPGPRCGRRRSPAQRGGSSARETLCGAFVRREPRLWLRRCPPRPAGCLCLCLGSKSIFIYSARVLITRAVESSLAATCFHDNETPRSLRCYLFARFFSLLIFVLTPCFVTGDKNKQINSA